METVKEVVLGVGSRIVSACVAGEVRRRFGILGSQEISKTADYEKRDCIVNRPVGVKKTVAKSREVHDEARAQPYETRRCTAGRSEMAQAPSRCLGNSP